MEGGGVFWTKGSKSSMRSSMRYSGPEYNILGFLRIFYSTRSNLVSQNHYVYGD